ncbi:MAG: carboxylating nicotinate-nucleotide diphosphorylase [Syntrophomonadaceae bacterium]|nr:carboxylating nicotinate-nucleotide diphosphorylase [Syntrophomonadaceae bacterium]
MLMNWMEVEQLVRMALSEDIGYRDITTENLIGPDLRSMGVFYSKQEGIVCGVGVAERVFLALDPSISFNMLKEDGDLIREGEEVARITGPTRTLLMGERVALNFLQHMSGIATTTFDLVDRVRHFPVKVVDTRKTTPGLRALEKYAVRVGGGSNHRFGLFDGVLIKDNHIRAAGGITEAVQTIQRSISHLSKIEVEVENLEQLREALSAGSDVVLLDNMEPDMMREAVRINAGRAVLEASGGITKDTLVEVAKTGVDLISIGGLTHSATALDISFNIISLKD